MKQDSSLCIIYTTTLVIQEIILQSNQEVLLIISTKKTYFFIRHLAKSHNLSINFQLQEWKIFYFILFYEYLCGRLVERSADIWFGKSALHGPRSLKRDLVRASLRIITLATSSVYLYYHCHGCDLLRGIEGVPPPSDPLTCGEGCLHLYAGITPYRLESN
jgi:hypothetical protein